MGIEVAADSQESDDIFVPKIGGFSFSPEPAGRFADLFTMELGLTKHGPLETKPAVENLNAGGVAERLIAPVLKTGDAERRSWVRIPPPPLS